MAMNEPVLDAPGEKNFEGTVGVVRDRTTGTKRAWRPPHFIEQPHPTFFVDLSISDMTRSTSLSSAMTRDQG